MSTYHGQSHAVEYFGNPYELNYDPPNIFSLKGTFYYQPVFNKIKEGDILNLEYNPKTCRIKALYKDQLCGYVPKSKHIKGQQLKVINKKSPIDKKTLKNYPSLEVILII